MMGSHLSTYCPHCVHCVCACTTCVCAHVCTHRDHTIYCTCCECTGVGPHNQGWCWGLGWGRKGFKSQCYVSLSCLIPVAWLRSCVYSACSHSADRPGKRGLSGAGGRWVTPGWVPRWRLVPLRHIGIRASCQREMGKAVLGPSLGQTAP